MEKLKTGLWKQRKHARYLEGVLGAQSPAWWHPSQLSFKRKTILASDASQTACFCYLQWPSFLLSFHNPPFPPLFSSSLPFSIALSLSFHTSLPFTPSSPFGFAAASPSSLALLIYSRRKGYHGERITSAHTSARAKREITQGRKNGSGVQTGRKRRESVYSNSKLTPLLW